MLYSLTKVKINFDQRRFTDSLVLKKEELPYIHYVKVTQKYLKKTHKCYQCTILHTYVRMTTVR